MILLQAGKAVPQSPLELILVSSTETKVVLAITGLFSLVSWFIIVLKWWQFGRIRRQGRRFFKELEQTERLADAYQLAGQAPSSPFARVLREAVTFYSDLKPGAISGQAPGATTLTSTQLEALRMVLAKEVAAERDLAARWIAWLAIIGSTSPLLGLLGTVLGVMDAFIGIASRGSGNLSAVAPGVAEALVATAAGLAAAIPAVMAYNLFVNRVRVFSGELDGFANEVIGSMAREGLV